MNISLAIVLENRNANQEQAIVFSFESHIMPFFKTFDLTNFRQVKMYNEGVDIVIKKHLQVLQDIYKKFSGREAIGGEERYMSLAEFVDLVTSTSVVDDNFGVREINVIFRLSMAVQVDEIRFERHTRMQFLEFVEAICRVADRVVVNLIADSGPIAVGNPNIALEKIEEEDANEEDTQQTNDEQSTKNEKDVSGSSSEAEENSRRSARSDAANPDEYNDRKKQEKADRKAGLGLLKQLNKTRMTLVAGIEMSETMTTSQKSPRNGGKVNKRRKRDIKTVTSAYNNVIGLDSKLQEYIRKIALISMGQEYAYNFIRKYNL